jgi:16S rRNA (cytosine1402-N4)-methyltransferase
MLHEAIEGLTVRPGGRYVDATIGLGGHAEAILDAASPGGRLLGIDRDPAALAACATRLERFEGAVDLAHGNFSEVDSLCEAHDFVPVDGVLMDLGISSMQLDSPGRGFSFQRAEPLDMRMDPGQELTAAHIVNEYEQDELAQLIREFGEERRARTISRAIVGRRPIRTTDELVSAVEQAVGRGRKRQIHPATLTFQALRIAVNQEMDNLADALPAAHGLLDGAGARMVVIAFHSLEDRIVKNYFRRESTDCICPPRTPACICGHSASLRRVTRRVRKPTEEEVARNPRARSARMRVVESIAERTAA